MTKLETIRAFADAGYTLIPLCSPTSDHTHWSDGEHKPCKTPGKVPARREWRETAPDAHAPEVLAQGNYGVLLKPGDLIVDIDPRNFTAGDDPVRRLMQELGAPLKSLMVKTGSGGYHIYLRKPADWAVRNGIKEFAGIEFKSTGQQVVGPGSMHQSGREYVIVAGAIDAVADAPQKLLAMIQRTHSFDTPGTKTYVNDAGTQGRYRDYLQNNAPTSGSFKVACFGRDLGLPPATVLELMLAVWNPRRAAPRSPEELKVRVEHAYTYAKGELGNKSAQAAFDALPAPAPTAKETFDPCDTPPSAKDLPWDTTAQGQMRKSFHNLMNYMRAAEYGLAKIFAFNEFTGRVEFVAPSPWHRGRLPKYPGVGDDDLKLLKGYLAARHAYEASVQNIEEAVTNVAYHERFHPVRRFLTKLEWDGVPRLDTWLRDYLGVEDSDYSRACARKTLCAAVMRVMVPGIKFDHVLVLEGAQDIGKSTAIAILAGPWAADFPVDPHNKDTVQLLQGRWIVELAEMEVTRRVEEEALKAFITRRTDMARLAYGRTVGEFPRQSIFIATKNPRSDGTYLKDETGNRRWWPVRCDPKHGLGQIDFAGLKAARDQLFAEAFVVARKEKLYMETKELKDLAKSEAGKRHAEHEWTEAVALWLERADGDAATRRDFYTGRDIFVHALNGTDRFFDRKSALNVASVMRALGWTVGFKRVAGHFCRGYLRPGVPSARDAHVPPAEPWMELV